MIGGGDWAEDRLVPDMMAALMQNRPVSIRSPDSIRPWQHVLDPLQGYLNLAEQLRTKGAEYAQAWNFGPRSEDARTVMWIVKRLNDLWGQGAGYEIDPGQHVYESHYLRLDCSKAESLLCWSPKLRLSTALEWVVEWYKGYQHQEDMRLITEAQIARYEGLEVA